MKNIRVLFIHHSTGGLLIRNRQIRKLLSQKAPFIEFWDHGYNLSSLPILSKIFGAITFKTSLSDSRGKMTGKDFNIIISNNSPKEYAEIFSRDSLDPTLKNILQFDVVAFKNCFPTSQIETQTKLKEYKRLYEKIFQNLAKYPNLFMVFTQPPLIKALTKSGYAKNARNLANWLVEQNKISKNIVIFDFFDALADKAGDNSNRLKRKYYSPIPLDSHPNKTACIEVGEIFVDWLIKEIKGYF